MAAWEEAYGVIADVFITVEKEMYAEAENREGGWRGYRPFVVNQKVNESDVITSFYFRPKVDQPIAYFKHGQFIIINAHFEGEEVTTIRQYSLADATGKD